MTVRIPIATDASATVEAIRQVQQAIQQAGQAGRELANLDLSHPELRTMSADLQRLQQNLQDLQRLGRGQAGAFSRGLGAGPLNTMDLQGILNALAQRYPEEGARLSTQRTVGRYIFGGTRWGPQGAAAQGPGQVTPATPMTPQAQPGGANNPPPRNPAQPSPAPAQPGSPGGPGGTPGQAPPPGAPPPPAPTAPGQATVLNQPPPNWWHPGMGAGGGGGGGGGGGPASQSALMTMAKRGGAFALGAIGVQKAGAMAMQGLSNAADEAIATDTLLRTLGDGLQDFELLRNSVRQSAQGLGITYAEAQRLTKSFATLSAAADANVVHEGVRFAAGVGRGMGVDAQTMVAGMGRAQFMGLNPKEFAAIMAGAVREANMQGRAPEVMDALLRYSEVSTRSLASSNDPSMFSVLYSTLSSQTPGLRGAGASELLMGVDNAVKNGGGAGDASQLLMSMAFARHGVTNPFQQEYIRAGGMFEPLNPNDPRSPTALGAIMEEFQKRYGNMEQYQKNHALGRLIGTDPRKAEAFLRAYTAQGSALDFSTGLQRLQGLGVDVESMDPTALSDVMEVATTRDTSRLEHFRKRVLGQTNRLGLPDSRIDPFRQALETQSGEELRRTLAQAMAAAGMDKNQGNTTQESQAAFANQLTEWGQRLLWPINGLRDSVSTASEVMNDLIDVIKDSAIATWGSDSAKEAARQRLALITDRWMGDGTTRSLNIASEARGITNPLTPSSSQEDRVREAYQAARAQGMNHGQAVAIAATGLHESGLDPSKVNPKDGRDGSDSISTFQWNSTRAKKYLEFLKGRQPTIPLSVEFLIKEMREGDERGNAVDFLRSNDPARSTALLTTDVIRPGKKEQRAVERAATGIRLNSTILRDPDATGRANHPTNSNGTGRTDSEGITWEPAPALREPGSQPAPAGASTPGPGASLAQPGRGPQLAGLAGFKIEPLEVQYRNPDGSMRGRDFLAVQPLREPSSYGNVG